MHFYKSFPNYYLIYPQCKQVASAGKIIFLLEKKSQGNTDGLSHMTHDKAKNKDPRALMAPYNSLRGFAQFFHSFFIVPLSWSGCSFTDQEIKVHRDNAATPDLKYSHLHKKY